MKYKITLLALGLLAAETSFAALYHDAKTDAALKQESSALSKRIKALTLRGNGELSDDNLVADLNDFARDRVLSYERPWLATKLQNSANANTSSQQVAKYRQEIYSALDGITEGGVLRKDLYYQFSPYMIPVYMLFIEALTKIEELKKKDGQ